MNFHDQTGKTRAAIYRPRRDDSTSLYYYIIRPTLLGRFPPGGNLAAGAADTYRQKALNCREKRRLRRISEVQPDLRGLLIVPPIVETNCAGQGRMTIITCPAPHSPPTILLSRFSHIMTVRIYLHKVKSMSALCPAIQYAYPPPKKRGQQYRHMLESGHRRCLRVMTVIP